MKKVIYLIIISLILYSPLVVFAVDTSVEVNTEIKGDIEDSNQVDSYLFTLDNPGYISISLKHEASTTGNGDIKFTLYHRDGKEVFNESSKGNDTTEITSPKIGLPEGSYTIKVGTAYTNFKGNYSLKINYTQVDDYESEFNEIKADANPIALNSVIHGSLYNSSDVDYYSFEIPKETTVKLTITHESSDNGTFKFEIIDPSDEVIESLSSMGNITSEDSTEEITLEPGTYNIKVSSAYTNAYGEYSIEISTGNNKPTINLDNDTDEEEISTPVESINENTDSKIEWWYGWFQILDFIHSKVKGI